MQIRTAFCSILILFFVLSGCASTTKAKRSPVTERPQSILPTATPAEKNKTPEPPKAQEPTPTIDMAPPSAFGKQSDQKNLPASKPVDPKTLTLAKGPIAINVEKMPLPDFIIYALGETLKVSFVMDQKVMDRKDGITLGMKEAAPSDKALEIVLGVLEKYELKLEERGGALYILSKAPETKQPVDIKVGREPLDSSSQILQVVPLKFIRPIEIEALLKEFYKTGVQIRSYPNDNVILLYGEAAQIRRILEFINTFDLPYLRQKKIAVLQLTYWPIDDFIKQISIILDGLGLTVAKTPREPGILLVPIKALRSVLAIAPDEKLISYVVEWKERLDKPDAAGTEERAYTYIPKFTRASDLMKSIRNLYAYKASSPTGPDTRTAATPGQAAQPPAAAVAPGAPGTQPSNFIPGLKISSDDQRNMILTIASPIEYRNILKLLEDLDVPPRQVLIEATVAELTLTDDLKYGLEWFIRNHVSNANVQGTSTISSLFGLNTGATGLAYQFITDSKDFSFLINAFAKDDKINVLSTPRLMVLDNQEATIQVGTDIPVITGEVTSPDISGGATGPSVLRNIQYRNTGVILKVRPTINTEGLLTLNISQEVSEVGSNPPGIDSPTILMRRINTSVVAAHGQSIALGGLMSESKTRTDTKIPLLGDIPILGYLFKSVSTNVRKTELLVFLTPTIMSTVDDFTKTTRVLKDEIRWLNK